MMKDSLLDIISSLSVDFMEISIADSGEFIGFHNHNWFDISYVMKGSLLFESDGKSCEVSKGQAIIIPPGKMHREVAKPGVPFEVLFLCLKFMKDGAPYDLARLFTIGEMLQITGYKEIHRIFGSILNEITYRHEGYLVKLNVLIYDLLITIYRSINHADANNPVIKSSHMRKEKIAQEIKAYIERHFDQKISLAHLSHTFFLSPQYISSLFKKQIGYTPVEYLNTIRIKRAKELLVSNHYSILEVAEKCGFSDLHYFYKVFKQFEQNTPLHFIEKSRNK